MLVTGASSGIGAATAELFAARGASLVLCARSEDALEEVRGRCLEVGAARGAEADVVVTDVGDPAQVQAAIDHAVSRFGRLDVCVNVAGITAYGAHTDTPAEQFEQVVRVNLLGAAAVARSALTVFRDQGEGTLVLVGSVLGRVAVPQMGAYVASKFGLRGLTRVLQQENRDLPRVRVTTVAPGSVRTGIYAKAAGDGEASASAPPPSTSPRTVARTIVRASLRPGREHDVDALGGLGNRALRAGYLLAPGVFDAAVGPLLRTFSLDPSDRSDPSDRE